MSDLKTLKDICINKQTGLKANLLRFYDLELRAEAIKRAKSHLQNKEKAEKLSNKESMWYWQGRMDESLLANDLTEVELNGEIKKWN